MIIFMCDDDPLANIKTEKYLRSYFKTIGIKDYKIYSFSCGEDAVSSKLIPDIAFLDVEMEGISGIKTAEVLKKKNDSLIVFILTSFSDYLDAAMRENVFRYLSKPLEKERLFRNMKDAVNLYFSQTKSVEIETKDRRIVIPLKKVICIESERHSSVFHTTDGDYLATKPLRYWVDSIRLPCFYQPHRSFLVNLVHVSDYDAREIRFFGSSCKAYMASRRYSDFKQKMMLYLEGQA